MSYSYLRLSQPSLTLFSRQAGSSSGKLLGLPSCLGLIDLVTEAQAPAWSAGDSLQETPFEICFDSATES